MGSARRSCLVAAVVLAMLSAGCSDDGSQGSGASSDVPPGEVIVGDGADTCEAASKDPIFEPQPDVAYMDQTESIGVCQIGFTLESNAVDAFNLDTSDCEPDAEFLLPFRRTNDGWVLHPDTADLAESAPQEFCAP